MGQDKLEIFLELLEIKNPLNYQRENDNFKKLLYDLAFNHDAFMYIYEELTEAQKPLLNDSHFCTTFYSVISKLNDEKFNQYFFQGMQEIIPIEHIRLEAIKRPQNQLLQLFVKEKDKPKTIDKIMEMLITLYDEDNERFEENIIVYKEYLKRLNTITAPKSKALATLMTLLNYERKKRGLPSALHLAEKLGFNIVERAKFIKDKFNISHYQAVDLNEKDYEGFELLFKKYPNKPKYELILELTDLKDFIKVANILVEKDIEQACYMWDLYESYIKDIPSKNITYKNLFPNNTDDVFEILVNIFTNDKITNSLHLYGHIVFNNKITPEQRSQEFVADFKDKILAIKFKVFGDKIPLKNREKKAKLKI